MTARKPLVCPYPCLLIGEAPVRGAETRAQWLHPDHCASGRRLLDLSGLTRAEFDATFLRHNLVEVTFVPGMRWSRDLASVYARDMLNRMVRAPTDFPGRVLLLGRNVADAFALTRVPLLEWRSRAVFYGREVALAPHPSGRNREWNHGPVRDAFREFMRASFTAGAETSALD